MASRALHTTFSPGEPTHASDFPTAVITGREDAFELHSVVESDLNRSPMILYSFFCANIIVSAKHPQPLLASDFLPTRSFQTDIETQICLLKFIGLT